MNWKLLVLLLLPCWGFTQVQAPDAFLGYKLGSKFTPHWKLMEYYREAAARNPGKMQLKQYGQTYEGRPLVLAFISSARNMARLEEIRSNNLKLAGVEGGSGSLESAVPIVWLSYNVHGNEASSSESSMMMLYALLDPDNKTSAQYLENTIVVIDPCLNPDGRDRYVNWYNSVMDLGGNPAVDAREHFEPWPGGRTNHYYFDLNRDWAWQTQQESRARMVEYHRWLPQIHVDFHEQGHESPYYFAPAAQPYHEVITPWQRDFQVQIGRNHARYFDEKGWLFFTKEYFDLLYPSYGDTYPIFNGAIGMTYEQAGHSRGGTAIHLQSGDTLTLYERAFHHFTTGMSTIETASKQAGGLLKEFRDYFAAPLKQGLGDYRSFVIKYRPEDRERINALTELLKKNQLTYSHAGTGSFRGYNYITGKEEGFQLNNADLVISTQQPRGAMVKVLFEPNTRVVDSNTYDITAWSLPYAYGLLAYGVKQAVPTGRASEKVLPPHVSDPYAYIIPWTGVSSARVVSSLIQRGIKLRFAEQPFRVGNNEFGRGAIIVVRTSNQYYAGLWDSVYQVSSRSGIYPVAVNTGFVDAGTDFGSSRIRLLKPRRIALLAGEGTSPNAMGEVWHFFERELGHPLTLINVSQFQRINWNDYDVLIMPNGNYGFLNNKESAERLKNWVEQGGQLIALENTVSQLARTDWALKLKKEDENKDTSEYSALRKYEDRERDFIPNLTPGSIYKLELDNTHPLAFGYPSHYFTLKQDDAIYNFLKEGGWNVGVIKKNSQVAGFVGSKLKTRLNDGLIFGVQELGNGRIVYLVDNVLFRGFWENGKLLFCNAVFLVGQ